MNEPTYRIIRLYGPRPVRRRILKRGLTLEQAQRYCSDPETSSSTSTNPKVRRKHEAGYCWFDGFEKEN